MNTWIAWSFVFTVLAIARGADGLRCSEFVRPSDAYICQEEKATAVDSKYEWTIFNVTAKLDQRPLYMKVHRVFDPTQSIQGRRQSKVMKEVDSQYIVKILYEHTVGSFTVQVYDPDNLQPLPEVLKHQSKGTARIVSLKVVTALASLLNEMHQKEWTAHHLSMEDVITGLKPIQPVVVVSLEQATRFGRNVTAGSDYHYWEPSRWAETNPERVAASVAMDQYNLGVIMYTIMHGNKFPFPGKTKSEVQENLKQGTYRISPGCQVEYTVLMVDLLLADREKRPPISVVVGMLKWIEGLRSPHHLESSMQANNKIREVNLTKQADPEFLSTYEIMMDDYRRSQEEKASTVDNTTLKRYLPTSASRKIVLVFLVGVVVLGILIPVFLCTTPPRTRIDSEGPVLVTSPIRFR
jgi:hypothetical protein